MTTIKDPIRQASLFTMNGLVDPRLMPGYSETKTEKSASGKSELAFIRRVFENLLKRRPSPKYSH
jgi:hypothetical protein